MSNDQTPTPIVDEHVEFAQALVELARKFEVDSLEVQFSLTGGRRFRTSEQLNRYNDTRVKFQWSEGRHGEPQSFMLRAEASIRVIERKKSDAVANEK